MHSTQSPDACFKPVIGNTVINRTDPLAIGLQSAYLFNEVGCKVLNNYGVSAHPVSAGRATMQTTPTWVGNDRGAALRFNSASSDYATIPASINWRPTTYPFCIALRAMAHNTGNGAVYWTNDDAVNTYAGITVLSSGDGIFEVRLGDNAGTGSTHRRGFNQSAAGGAWKWITAVFSITSKDAFKSWTNGVDNTGSIAGTAGSIAYNGLSTGSMGREDISVAAGYSYYSDHTIEFIYFWHGRILTDADALALTVNPYRMFENTSKAKLYVFPGWHLFKINDIAAADLVEVNDINKYSIGKIIGA